MAENKMPASLFVDGLKAAYERKDGYIMGSKGQDPKKWSKDSWWFSQYTTSAEHTKALYWREHASRVWDCNGMAEGLYEDYTGININTKARYNYAQWCEPKGKGLIPAEYRVPGAAVFWGERASEIHHVAYLVEPVNAGKPEGDWYLIEARGVNYGVVRTKLFNRNPDYWGLMTKYFDYENSASEISLRKGMKGDAVKEMQEALIRLGYSCGKYGADGDFGNATEAALIKMQENNRLEADGIYGPESKTMVEKLLALIDSDISADTDVPENDLDVTVTGGSVWLWSAPPSLGGKKVKVVHKGDTFMSADNKYMPVEVDGTVLWGNVDYLSLKER